MNVDSTFQIGKDHTVCEDYALAGVKADTAYAVVCDGCSASADVDFGARCLAMSAKRELRLKDSILDFDAMTVIKNAEKAIDIFPYLSPQFLDATLLVAAINNKKLVAYMYGDGVLVHKNKNGVTAVHIQLSSGAPDYLSYHLDPIRKQSYHALPQNVKEVTIFSEGKLDTSRTGDYKPFEPFIYTTDMEEGDTISVITDGINSFRKSDNTAIPWNELIEEFTGFKSTTGEFTQRRIGAFKRKCVKDGWHHHDDISIASIVA